MSLPGNKHGFVLTKICHLHPSGVGKACIVPRKTAKYNQLVLTNFCFIKTAILLINTSR